MSAMDVQKPLVIIKAGESQSVEFKSDFSPDVGKTICAFANTNPGTLLLGITDDGKIQGVSEKIEEQIANIAHSCKPSIYPEITKIIHDGKLLLAVEVPHSTRGC